MTSTKTAITFQELGLGAVILKALKEIGFEVTFPIQKAAIPRGYNHRYHRDNRSSTFYHP